MFLEILVERRDRRCRFAVDAVERLRRLNPGLICCCPFGAAEKLSLCFGGGVRFLVEVFRLFGFLRLRPTSVGATAAAGSEPWDQPARAGERPKGFWIWDLRFCDFAILQTGRCFFAAAPLMLFY